MGTAKFNLLDKIIASWRLNQIERYFDKDDFVLDFGCGHQAYLLFKLSKRIKRGIGLDYEAVNKKIGNIEIKKFYFKSKLPFKDKTFTKIAMLAVVEHLDLDLVYPLFEELARVLKSKGEIILTTPTRESKPLMEFLAFKLGIISRLEVRDHKKYYGKKDFEELASQTGFAIIFYKRFQFGLNSLFILQKV